MERRTKFYQYETFLETKKDLDDSAVSPNFWRKLKQTIRQRTSSGTPFPRRVLDCGCGTGGMLFHLLKHGFEFEEYHGIDIHETLLAIARRKTKDGHFRKLNRDPKFHAMSVYDLAHNSRPYFPQTYDMVCALSLAEHVEIDEMLGNIWSVLEPGGLLVMPINYDGQTSFEPVKDRNFEGRLIDNFNSLGIEGQVYEGRVGGNAYCGRQLLHSLRRNGFRVLAFEAEDWVIWPSDGYPHYRSDYVKFLEYVIKAVGEANLLNRSNRKSLLCSDSNEESISDDERKMVNEWVLNRLLDLKNGELVYTCDQIGVLAEKVVCPIKSEILSFGESKSDSTTI